MKPSVPFAVLANKATSPNCMTTLPLMTRTDPDSFVAWRHGQGISVVQFLHDVHHVAAQIPAQVHVLNLCADRYLFAVGLFASMLKQSISLLPNATSPELVADLVSRYPDLYCLIEPGGNALGLPPLVVSSTPYARQTPPELPISMPVIHANQIVAEVFTSGSTGVPQAHHKTWGKLTANAQGGAQALWRLVGGTATVVGTVPSQHMYGFESTILMPLLGGGYLHSDRPFFPADIVACLDAAPRPRALVTTPFHLKNLLDAELPLPQIDLIVSATAPLSPTLADRAERAFKAPLHEIYGSTETGQIATRRTVKTAEWTCFKDIKLEQHDNVTWASGGHIEMPIALNDVIELRVADDSHARFILHGRNSDMVNIAGKRTSLAYLNHVLNSLPGVTDGAFHHPDEEPIDGVARLTAFVVAPGVNSQEILTGLREHIDPVFMPRPLVFVETLPRNSTGKLTLATLKVLSAQIAANEEQIDAQDRA